MATRESTIIPTKRKTILNILLFSFDDSHNPKIDNKAAKIIREDKKIIVVIRLVFITDADQIPNINKKMPINRQNSLVRPSNLYVTPLIENVSNKDVKVKTKPAITSIVGINA